MLEGKCPKCSYRCSGWALRIPRNQTCPKCGAGLEITEGRRKVATGYSPFTAEKYYIDMPSSVPSAQDSEKEEDKGQKK